MEALEPNYRAALAAELLRIGRFKDAREVVDAALWLEADHVWSLTLLSALERQAGDFVAAEDAARRALARDPANLRAWLDLAEALRRSGRPDEASQAMGDAAQLALSPQERAALARAYARITRPEEAAAQWRRVLEDAPPGALQEEARRALEAPTRGAATVTPTGRG
jgi:tetratricopeptide (TPR) repeat protein